MDMAAPELNKEIMEIVPSRLQSLLELALRTSAANNDPYKVCMFFKNFSGDHH